MNFKIHDKGSYMNSALGFVGLDLLQLKGVGGGAAGTCPELVEYSCCGRLSGR